MSTSTHVGWDGSENHDAIGLSQEIAATKRSRIDYKLGIAASRELFVDWRDANGVAVVEQFQIAGLAGNDTIGFAGMHPDLRFDEPSVSEPLDLIALVNRSSEAVATIEGNSGNDTIIGSIAGELISGSPVDELGLEIYDSETDTSLSANQINPTTFAASENRSKISIGSNIVVGTTYLLKVSSPNLVPTIYDLRFSLTGNTDPVALNAIPSVDLGVRREAVRRDLTLGGPGDDKLLGGPGKDWILGGAGNDVISGGLDRMASDLLLGGPGDDTFQIIPDELPRKGNEPDSLFDPVTGRYRPTANDIIDGGGGTDRMLYVGGDLDRRGFEVPDFAALRYNTGFHERHDTICALVNPAMSTLAENLSAKDSSSVTAVAKADLIREKTTGRESALSCFGLTRFSTRRLHRPPRRNVSPSTRRSDSPPRRIERLKLDLSRQKFFSSAAFTGDQYAKHLVSVHQQRWGGIH
ncbi:MAG: calcium-binding protein [Phycisphaera sp. RhM]|nr:calcium-binding protein [Phycisphaera sp. RhM]